MKPPPLSLEEAQTRLLALAAPLPAIRLPASHCAGFHLAEPLFARRDQPALPLSAMDGYAVRAADLPGTWRVHGESAAGHPFAGTVQPGEAVRISTGAAVPAGADCVLLQEDCTRQGDALTLTGTPPEPPHRHIRPRAMDFAQGTPLLGAGSRIGPAQMALAIAGGHGELPVHARPRVAVIDSGDELCPPGADCGPFGLPASNGAMLAALAAPLSASVSCHGPVPDRLEALMAALEQAREADVVVTSGGASVGDHDLVRPALEAIGATLDFWRVAIKPGKPLLVARRGRQIILGLPGNPASAFVTATLFLKPLLRALAGAADPMPQMIAVPLAIPMAAGGSRAEFIRAVWDGQTVTPDGLQDSGAIGPLARANALIRRPAGAPAQDAGSVVPVLLLEWTGFA